MYLPVKLDLHVRSKLDLYAGTRPPVPICAPTYTILGSFISIASLGVNKGVLNKIKLTMRHHNGMFAAVN